MHGNQTRVGKNNVTLHQDFTASNVSKSQNQKSWTLYKMYWRLANGILMGTQRSESRGVYDCGGPNEWLYDLITLDFFTAIKTKVYGKF